MQTIILVDDDLNAVKLMESLLTGEGYGVRRATWLSHPYSEIKVARPDLVVLDLRMPVSGWEILALLRLDPATRAIPVLICTADTRSLQEFLEPLAGDGLQVQRKPFDLDELLAKVRRLLGPGGEGPAKGQAGAC